MAPGRKQLQKIQMGLEQYNGTPATYFTRARVSGGMMNDDRSINMVDEMLGIIPGQTRTYVTSASGTISLGGTPMSPQQLPIHLANAMTGITYGALSAASSTSAVVDGVITLTCSTTARSVTMSASTTRATGDVLYSAAGDYIGTIKTGATGTTFALVNYPLQTLAANAYRYMTAATALTNAFTYNITLPTTAFPTNSVSYTIQAGDDFEQETTTYAKCGGFSTSGGSGGAIDLSAQYTTQAVRLGVVGPGTITVSSTTVTGAGTTFVADDVGRILYTLDNVVIGTISAYSSATSVTLAAAPSGTYTTSTSYRIGGFSITTIPTPIEVLIFARSRLFIDEVATFPIATPTPVVASFLQYSAQLQCQWTPKFTGEGYQGIDPTFSFSLFTNYAMQGDFTIEHNETASGKYSASPVESLKYAWRYQVPKIIQIDLPGSVQLNWFTPTATNMGSTIGTLTVAPNSTTVTAGTAIFTDADVGYDLFVNSGATHNWVGRIASIGAGVQPVATCTIASPYLGINLAAVNSHKALITQPYFPVAGQGPLKTYTGVSIRVPITISQVSPISDQSGNDIVTVQWIQRYNPTAASAGDIRIVNQLATLSVAG